MGCGGHVGQEKLEALEHALTPTWHALPKNAFGRIDRRPLRYLVTRHFSL